MVKGEKTTYIIDVRSLELQLFKMPLYTECTNEDDIQFSEYLYIMKIPLPDQLPVSQLVTHHQQ